LRSVSGMRSERFFVALAKRRTRAPFAGRWGVLGSVVWRDGPVAEVSARLGPGWVSGGPVCARGLRPCTTTMVYPGPGTQALRLTIIGACSSWRFACAESSGSGPGRVVSHLTDILVPMRLRCRCSVADQVGDRRCGSQVCLRPRAWSLGDPQSRWRPGARRSQPQCRREPGSFHGGAGLGRSCPSRSRASLRPRSLGQLGRFGPQVWVGWCLGAIGRRTERRQIGRARHPLPEARASAGHRRGRALVGRAGSAGLARQLARKTFTSSRSTARRLGRRRAKLRSAWPSSGGCHGEHDPRRLPGGLGRA